MLSQTGFPVPWMSMSSTLVRRPSAPVQRFTVSGTPGPLVDGEQARACRWGDTLAAMIVKEDDLA
jgi:hypothetical protein